MGEAQVKKTKKIMAILAAISGGASAVIMPIWLIISDIRSDVRSAQNDTAAVAEGTAPSLVELQGLGKKLVERAKDYDEWRADVDSTIEAQSKIIQEQQIRITYLEGFLRGQHGGRRFNPEENVEEFVKETSPAVVEFAGPTELMLDVDEPPVQQMEVPKAPVISNVKEAKKYRDARKKQQCQVTDPECGIEALE